MKSRRNQPPVFIINLAKAENRRTFMCEQMEQQQIVYEFFPAVDGSKLTQDFLSRFDIGGGEKKLRRYLSKGELGCLFSHYQLYKKICQEDIPYAIILEDDAKLHKNFAQIINNINQLPLKVELLLLGYWTIHPGIPLFGKQVYPLGLWYSKKLKVNELSCTYYVGRFISLSEGSHCYMISQQGARNMLRLIDSFAILPIDVLLNSNHIITSHGLTPSIAAQDKRKSLEQHIKGRGSPPEVQNIPSFRKTLKEIFITVVTIVSKFWTPATNLPAKVRYWKNTVRISLRLLGTPYKSFWFK